MYWHVKRGRERNTEKEDEEKKEPWEKEGRKSTKTAAVDCVGVRQSSCQTADINLSHRGNTSCCTTHQGSQLTLQTSSVCVCVCVPVHMHTQCDRGAAIHFSDETEIWKWDAESGYGLVKMMMCMSPQVFSKWPASFVRILWQHYNLRCGR